jgi:hypothetical protein
VPHRQLCGIRLAHLSAGVIPVTRARAPAPEAVAARASTSSRQPVRERIARCSLPSVSLVLMEFGDFAMMRKLLRNVKRRAERLATREPTPTPAVGSAPRGEHP